MCEAMIDSHQPTQHGTLELPHYGISACLGSGVDRAVLTARGSIRRTRLLTPGP